MAGCSTAPLADAFHAAPDRQDSLIRILPDLLKSTLDLGGSDLHLSIGSPPQVRVNGHLQRLDLPALTADVTKSLAYSVLTDAQKKTFEETWELDLAFGLRGVGRFRCNVFNQKGAVGASSV